MSMTCSNTIETDIKLTSNDKGPPEASPVGRGPEDLEANRNHDDGQGEQGWQSWCSRRKLVIFLLFSLVVIVTIILIPTVFLKDGASWESTGLSLHSDGNPRKNQYQQEHANYGEDVALSGDGMRLAFAGKEAVEIWDWQAQRSLWSFRHRIESITSPGSNVQIELSSNGSRLMLVQGDNVSPRVVVYEDTNGNGQLWTPVGETLNHLSYLNLSRPNWVSNATEFDLQQVRAYPFAQSISLSKDGSTMAIGSSHTNTLDCAFSSSKFSYRCYRQVGAVQIFRHKDTFKSTIPKEYAHLTWLPMGEILGEHEDEELGSTVVLSTHGTKLVVISKTDSGGSLRSFQYIHSDKEWTRTTHRMSIADDYNQLVAISEDATILVIGDPYWPRDPYMEKRKSAGRILIYRAAGGWDHLTTLKGTEKYEAFGSSVALTPSGEVLVVGSSLGIETFRRRGDEWKRFGNRFGKPTRQRDCCFEKFSWGEAVAVSSSGRRVAGGAPKRRDKHEGLLSVGDVGIWDLQE